MGNKESNVKNETKFLSEVIEMGVFGHTNLLSFRHFF